MQDRLPKAGKKAPPSPRAPGTGPLPAAPSGRVHGRTGHTSEPARNCSTCREDLAVPDLNYRLVLRCTTTGLDH